MAYKFEVYKDKMGIYLNKKASLININSKEIKDGEKIYHDCF